MSSLNRVQLIGRLGKDPEIRYTREQTPFAKFSLATSERFVVNGSRREKTSWHHIIIWGKLAEVAGRYLRKGKQVFLEGKIEYNEWEKNGERRIFTQIRVDHLVMLGPRDSGTSGPAGRDYGPPASSDRPMQYDDMPLDAVPVPSSDDFEDEDIPF